MHAPDIIARRGLKLLPACSTTILCKGHDTLAAWHMTRSDLHLELVFNKDTKGKRFQACSPDEQVDVDNIHPR